MIGWIDASAGASGDMLLGALVGAGVPLDVMQQAIDAVSPEPVTLRVERVRRNGFAATRVHVEGTDSATHRSWAEIRDLPVGDRARRVFARLAAAEAEVHGTTPDDVHFHEVGALDAIADVVGVCAGLDHLGLEALVVSPVAVGSGSVDTEHGRLSVPPPAVVALLRGIPSYSGPADTESCTPTGAALLVANATEWADQPAMVVDRIGLGAGGRDPDSHTNVVRLLVGSGFETGPGGPPQPASPLPGGTPHPASPLPGGTPHPASSLPGGAPEPTGPVVLETNVDDLDPRLWPSVIQELLDAGASDAWLTPILMKKGRPAHTLHVLVAAERADVVRRAVFTHTTSIGLREYPVAKTALDRSMTTVEVDGHAIDVKLASQDGVLLNVQPEYEHVAAAARALGRPIKDVLQQAVAEARRDR